MSQIYESLALLVAVKSVYRWRMALLVLSLWLSDPAMKEALTGKRQARLIRIVMCQAQQRRRKPQVRRQMSTRQIRTREGFLSSTRMHTWAITETLKLPTPMTNQHDRGCNGTTLGPICQVAENGTTNRQWLEAERLDMRLLNLQGLP